MKMTAFLRWLKPVLVLSFVCSFAMTAAAQNYYPTEIGNTWVLITTDGAERRTYTLEGPENIDGEELILLKIATETLGTETVDIDNYFVTAEAGALLLHQTATAEGTFGTAEATFDPPVVFFPAALPLAHKWEIVTETELKIVGPVTSTSTIEVVAIEDVETPSGIFENCVKLEIKRRVVTALAVLRSTSHQWLAPDVGPIKFEDVDQGVVFELENYNLVEAPEVDTPVVETPAEPVVEEPTVPTDVVAEEAAAEEPVVEEPAEEAAAEEPVVEEPAEEVPAEEPVVAEPMVPTTYNFDVMLQPGLNMISIPLMPEEPYTAKSLAEMFGSTIVIRLDTALQRLVAYSVAEADAGFSIDGGSGYIVNTPTGGMVTFTGKAWKNTPDTEEPAAEVVAEEAPAEAPAEEAVAQEPAAEDGGAAAPALSTYKSAWAFVITSDLQHMAAGTTYTAVAENLRTGTVVTEQVSGDVKRFSTGWADVNRNSVVEAGDKLEIALYDEHGTIVSGPFQHTVSTSDIRNAYMSVQLRVGDVQPQKTILAQNFPNPFNPETWIPYQLSQATEVKIQIYDISGHLVRTLDLGWQARDSYMTSSSAAYWDGKNELGERVSSGIYFYTLQTADFAATRRMVILK